MEVILLILVVLWVCGGPFYGNYTGGPGWYTPYYGGGFGLLLLIVLILFLTGNLNLGHLR